MHMRDIYHERLVEHLTEREWSPEQIHRLSRTIARSALMSAEGVLEVLEYQQGVDEEIAAKKEHDRWAIGREFATQPTTYLSDGGWDEHGNFHPPVLERADEINAHFQARFEGLE